MLPRRTPPITPLVAPLLALATIALSGCATFQGADVAARVGDAEFTDTELEARVAEFVARADVSTAPGDDTEPDQLSGAVRQTIWHWIGLQLAYEADIADAYLEGPVAAGFSCIYVVPARDIATGDGWVDRLRDDEAWDTIAREALPGGGQGQKVCFATAVLGEVAGQLAAMNADDPFRSITFDGVTSNVIRMQTLDEIDGFDLISAAAQAEPASIDTVRALAADLDIEVSPRYGSFDAESLRVIPIG